MVVLSRPFLLLFFVVRSPSPSPSSSFHVDFTCAGADHYLTRPHLDPYLSLFVLSCFVSRLLCRLISMPSSGSRAPCPWTSSLPPTPTPTSEVFVSCSRCCAFDCRVLVLLSSVSLYD